ncbi:MAG: acetyl-CoA carboxylase biotin carboxylase subunit [Actinomycetes bacterium]
MFDKILVANRGEIACRVMRTARRLGIATVAVFSEADRNALHLQFADEVVGIGPARSGDSYLSIDRIVDACLKTGATAVHPGYGFLAENAELCERLEREGIAFIGPRADSIRAMGDKIAAKALALEAGVGVVPGSDIVLENEDAACRAAAEVGYPVMLKAAAGGGGKGIRVAGDDAQLRAAFAACRNEARSSFGDDRVFVEKFIEDPRHIEFQVLGDAFGDVVHLWERDCSIQRRHQKVIEEAPSSCLDGRSREAMGAQSVALAKAARYQSAGTVEFVVDKHGSFYFLEMNTRIQVEHPVTEMITGVDLVEAMIRVAAGEPLPFSQADIRCDGWAIECRINAEDPFHNFLPSSGRLVRYIPPRESAGRVRVDTGVAEGGAISPHYDSMIAKVITHDATREGAIAMMRRALDQFVVRGVATNIAFQAALLRHTRFLAGDLHTGFMAEEYPRGFNAADMPHVDKSLLVAVAAFVHRSRIDRHASVGGQMPGHELKVAEEWTVVLNGERNPVTVRPVSGGYVVLDAEQSREIVSGWRLGEPLLCGACNGRPFCIQVEHVGQMYRLTHGGTQADVRVMTARTTELLQRMPEKPERDLSRFLLSPMPGLVTLLEVDEGQAVRIGEPLLVIEAMKMENILRADRDCVVDRLLVKPGDSVAVGQRVMEFR